MIPTGGANYIQNQINFGKRFNFHFIHLFSLAITDKNLLTFGLCDLTLMIHMYKDPPRKAGNRIDRAPAFDGLLPIVPWSLAPIRLPRGTRRGRLTVASSRTWRGSPVSVAQDLIFNTTCHSRYHKEPPPTGIQPCYSGLQVTGHCYLPSSTVKTKLS